MHLKLGSALHSYYVPRGVEQETPDPASHEGRLNIKRVDLSIPDDSAKSQKTYHALFTLILHTGKYGTVALLRKTLAPERADLIRSHQHGTLTLLIGAGSKLQHRNRGAVREHRPA